MQKWEYIWIVGGTDPFDTITVDGRKIRIDEHMNNLGQLGWELVTVTLQNGSITAGRKFTYWLKRPKAE
jgi:hypothetical protein